MVQILDGAVGTELIARGVSLQGPGWSVSAVREAPEILARVHADYDQAGATLHTANTFRAQPKVAGPSWREVLRAAVDIARDSIAPGSRVLGSMAPLEDCYRPDLSPGAKGRADHARMADALARAGCDILLCETFPNEVEALVAADEAVRTGLPAWLSWTPGPFGDLFSPEELGEVAKRAADTGVDRVLVNCVGATRALPYVKAIAKAGLPFGVYANAGAKDEGLGWEATDRRAAEAYADVARTWVDAGATVVGGCCGTTPLHIEALAERFG